LKVRGGSWRIDGVNGGQCKQEEEEEENAEMSVVSLERGELNGEFGIGGWKEEE
jgi:hypothetical protein